ncbi:hypothetical protein B5S33_g5255 [[Candida] boidinii]|nr:hypothetical protein B5S30_g1923 [[Candida] boidinii]OWB86554.1 hypothetical protein B5S33_g5255 [[Candida] boidinii]
MTTTAPSTNPSQSSSNQSGLTKSQNSLRHNELNEHMDEPIEPNNSTQKPITINNTSNTNNTTNDNNDNNDSFNPPSTPRLSNNAKLSDAPLMQHSNSSTEISPQRNSSNHNNKLKEPTTPSMKRHSFDPRNNLFPKTPERTPHGLNNEGTPLLSPSHHIFQTPSSSSLKRRSTDFYQLLKSPEVNLINNNSSNEYDLKKKSLDLHKATMNISSLISGNGSNSNTNINTNNGSTITETSLSSSLLASPGNSGYVFHDNFLLTSPKRSSNGYRVKKKNNAEIKEISENLKTRLNYAALKIQNGWEQKSIEELQMTLSHDDGDETNPSTKITTNKIIRDNDNDEDVEIYDAVHTNNNSNKFSNKRVAVDANDNQDDQDKPMTDSDSTFDNFWKSDRNTLPDYKELNISKSTKVDLSHSSNSLSHKNSHIVSNKNLSPAKPNHSSPSKRTPRMTLDQIAKKHANGNAEDALVDALSPKRSTNPPSQPPPPTPGQQHQQQKILPSLNTEDQAEKEAIMSLMSLSSPVKKSHPFFLPQNNISTTATSAKTLTSSRKNSTSPHSSNLPSPTKQPAGFNLPISSPYHTRSISLGGTLPNQSSSLNGLNPSFAQLNQPFRTPPASSVSSFPLQQPFEHSKQVIQQQQQQQPLGSQNQYSFPKMSPMRKSNVPLYNNDNETDGDNRTTGNYNGPKSPRKKRNSSSSSGQFQNITPNSFMISSPSSFQQQQHSQSRQHSRVNSANNIVASSPGPTYPLGIHPITNNSNNLDGDDDRTASDYSD